MRVKHVPQASGPGAYHTPRRCEYCYIRANLVEGSFRLEMGPLTQWNRPFFPPIQGHFGRQPQGRCWEPTRIYLEATKLKSRKSRNREAPQIKLKRWQNG